MEPLIYWRPLPSAVLVGSSMYAFVFTKSFGPSRCLGLGRLVSLGLPVYGFRCLGGWTELSLFVARNSVLIFGRFRTGAR